MRKMSLWTPAAVASAALVPSLSNAQVEVGGTYTAATGVIVTLKVLVGGIPIAQDSDTTTMNGTLRTVVTLDERPAVPSDIASTVIQSGRVEAWELTIPDGDLNLMGVNVRIEGFRYLFGDCFGQPGTPTFNFLGNGQAFLDQRNADVEYEGRIILSGGTPPFAFNETIELAPLSGFTNILSTYTLLPTEDLQGVRQRLRLNNAGPITDDFEFGGFTFRLEVALAGGGTSIDGFDTFEPSRIVCCPDRIAPGTFHDGGGAAEIPLGFGTGDHAVADFTGDGHNDIAVAESQRVDVLPSTGPGVFGAPLSINFPENTTIHDLRAANLDGDADTDLVVVATNFLNDDDGVHVCLNNGDGTFAPPVFVAINTEVFAADIGDLDGDSDQDIVVVRNRLASPNIFVLRNNGAGAFAAPEPFTSTNAPSGIALGDIDGDNDLDMAVPLGGADFLGFRRNDGLGNFTSISGFNLAPSGGDRPVGVALADLDNDNDLDAVTVNASSDNITRLRNNNGLFTNATLTAFALTVTDNPLALVASDIDDDGDRDIAIAYQGLFPASGGVNTLLNDGAGAFSGTVNYPSTHAQTRHLSAADLDRDSDPDLLLTTLPFALEPGGLTLLINDCTGATPPPPCPGDLNNDRAVNTADLVIFLGDFGSTVTPGTGPDFNSDGSVNTTDLVFFLGRFGTACP